MKRLSVILLAVLAAQLAIAFALTFSGGDHAAFQASEPLLAFDPKSVDEIAIDESAANSVTMKKKDAGWIVPALADFPADGQRVTSFLDKLAELKKGWPVATSGDAAERFKLTEKTHERRIVLSGGGKPVATLLVGTSPSYRQAHIRKGGDDTIYNATFASYEAGARGEEWMDRDFLAIPQDKITGISVGDMTLERKEGRFALAGVAENEQAVEAKVGALAQAVAHPTFDAIQGKGADKLAQLDPPDIQITIKRNEGGDVIYKYKKEASGGAYLLASSAHDYVFRVAEASIKPITEATRANLVKPKDSPKPAAPQTSQSSQPDGNGG